MEAVYFEMKVVVATDQNVFKMGHGLIHGILEWIDLDV